MADAKHTIGPVWFLEDGRTEEEFNKGRPLTVGGGPNNDDLAQFFSIDDSTVKTSRAEAAANARLFAEAINVATETGMTPRQREDWFQAIKSESQQRRETIEVLEAQHAALLAACQWALPYVERLRDGEVLRAAIAKAIGAA